MCGIAVVRRLDSRAASKQVFKRYSKQKNRGQDGFGYVAIKGDGKIRVKRYQFEHEIRKDLERAGEQTIIFHHRYPTSTPNVPEAAHPIKVSHSELAHNYYVVHNGVITNDGKLKKAHEALGYRYTTELVNQVRTIKGVAYELDSVFNDSEALAVELARAIEGKTVKVEAEGAAAFCVLQTTKQGRAIALYYGTNGGNPLTVQTEKEFIAIASQGGTQVQDNVIYRLDLDTNEVQIVTSFALTPFWQERRVGFVPYTDTYGVQVSPAANPHYLERYKYNPTGYDDMTTSELESELESLDDEIIGAFSDREYAKNEGRDELADECYDDYLRLLEERSRITQLLERKTLESASRD